MKVFVAIPFLFFSLIRTVQAVEPPFPADLRIAITNVSSGKTSEKEAGRITSEIERWIFTNAVNHSLAEISGTLRREHLLVAAERISWEQISEPKNDYEVDALYLNRGTNEWLAVDVYLRRQEEVDTNLIRMTIDGQVPPPEVHYASAPPVIFRKTGTNVMLFETGSALREHEFELKEAQDPPGDPDLFVSEISKWRLLGFIPGIESSNIPDVMISDGPDGSGKYVDFYQLHFDRTKGKYVYADSLEQVSSIVKLTTKVSSAKFTVRCLSEDNLNGFGTPIEQWTDEQTFSFGGPPKTSAKE
jgi:hypothetical protein